MGVRVFLVLADVESGDLSKQDNNNQNEEHHEGGVLTERHVKVKRPSLYKVLLHNDDYTPMEFVVTILEKIFGKKHEDATQIMLAVHTKGLGLCGVFPYEIAETKVAQVTEMARENEHPLQCTMERV